MANKRSVKKAKVAKVSSMAKQEREVIEIDDSSPSPVTGTPLKPVFCLKNRDEIGKFEEREECFILEFDPYHDLGSLKRSLPEEFDLCVVGEKGQVISHFWISIFVNLL